VGKVLAAVPGYKARVLVVDDDPDTAESFCILLRKWGHEVRFALDGENALTTADEFLPEVVLLDIGLPAMSGFEVAQRLRQRPRLEGTVLVAQTGFGRHQDRERAEQVGFDAYFLKPVDLVVLERFLATLDKSALP
jgi:CheY-like chemotaxis protein